MGIGHAIDRSLLDEVAWRTADTPSKALALVGSLIRDPASRAQDATAAIAALSHQRLATATQTIEALRDRVIGGAEHRGESQAAELNIVWAGLRAVSATLDQLHARCAAEANRGWHDCRNRAPEVVARASDACLDLQSGIDTAVRRRLAGIETGDTAMATITLKAAALIETQALHCDALIRSIATAALDRLRRAADDLTRAEGTIADTDISATLQRGYALALDADGHLIRTCAAAIAAHRVTLLLTDGTVATVVEALQPATRTLHSMTTTKPSPTSTYAAIVSSPLRGPCPSA